MLRGAPSDRALIAGVAGRTVLMKVSRPTRPLRPAVTAHAAISS
jgi:hypothetical protein